MRVFSIFWVAQVISLMGSAMTWFAFTLWVWQKTGQASSLSTISFLAFLPSILFMPIAGIYVDRWNRIRTLVFSNKNAGFPTLMVLLLTAGISGALIFFACSVHPDIQKAE